MFICYKETDQLGNRTQDSVYAQDIYSALTKEGYKVFFSRITLEDKLGSAYEPYIFAALNSAKVMLVVGTEKDHFNAVWVKNEWSRYLSLIKTGKDKTLIPVYNNMSPYDMPEEFQYLQSQDMGKVGFLQDLVRGIKKIVDVGTVTVTQTVGTTAVIVDTMLKRAADAMAHFDWQKASRCYDNVLDYDDQNEQAMIGKMLINFKVPTLKMLKQTATTIASDQYYTHLVRNGSRETARMLTELENAIQERIREAQRKEKAKKKAASAKAVKIVAMIADVIVVVVAASQFVTQVAIPNSTYKDAERLLEAGTNCFGAGQYPEAVAYFESIPDYKDAADQVLQAKYKYCADTKEVPTDTTRTYIRELVDLGYKDSAKIAETVFAWKADLRLYMNLQIGTQSGVGIDATLSGGDGGSTKVKFTIVVGGETLTYCDEKEYKAGEEAQCFINHPYMDLSVKTFTIKAYDENGKLIGTFTGIPEGF